MAMAKPEPTIVYVCNIRYIRPSRFSSHFSRLIKATGICLKLFLPRRACEAFVARGSPRAASGGCETRHSAADRCRRPPQHPTGLRLGHRVAEANSATRGCIRYCVSKRHGLQPSRCL